MKRIDTCPACEGTGMMTRSKRCPVCKGSGVVGSTGNTIKSDICPFCNANLSVDQPHTANCPNRTKDNRRG